MKSWSQQTRLYGGVFTVVVVASSIAEELDILIFFFGWSYGGVTKKVTKFFSQVTKRVTKFFSQVTKKVTKFFSHPPQGD